MADEFDEFLQTYGPRQITSGLNASRVACRFGLVWALMRQLGLKAVRSRPNRVATVHGVEDQHLIDLTERDLTSMGPHTTVVGDITDLRTRAGFVYPVAMIELTAHMLAGWQFTVYAHASWMSCDPILALFSMWSTEDEQLALS